MLSTSKQRLNDDGTVDIYRSEQLDFRRFWTREFSTVLGHQFTDWWMARASRTLSTFPRDLTETLPKHFEDMIPAPEAFEPDDKPLFAANVEAENPMFFKVRFAGARELRLGSYMNGLQRESLAIELLWCKERGHPLFHQVEQELAPVAGFQAVPLDIYRLMLPVGQPKVTHVLAFARHVSDRSSYKQRAEALV